MQIINDHIMRTESPIHMKQTALEEKIISFHLYATGGGGYSTLGWVRMCGPEFRPPPYN